MVTTRKSAVAKSRRLNALRAVLESQRAELVRDLQHKIRGVSSGGSADHEVRDAAESSELDIQGDIGFALIQLKAETLNSVEAALRRITEGNYGECFECGAEIAEARLRALPFAVRCRDCEQLCEADGERERWLAKRRGSSPLLLDAGI
jgi:DnaK suppressor protein